MAQVAVGEESEEEALAEADAETGSVDESEEDVEDEAAEDDSADNSPSEDARKEPTAEDPWPAHSNPAIGRTIKSVNSLLTQQRFTRPPELGAAARTNRP